MSIGLALLLNGANRLPVSDISNDLLGRAGPGMCCGVPAGRNASIISVYDIPLFYFII